jgi:TP901 family phage tail tape measure protein
MGQTALQVGVGVTLLWLTQDDTFRKVGESLESAFEAARQSVDEYQSRANTVIEAIKNGILNLGRTQERTSDSTNSRFDRTLFRARVGLRFIRRNINEICTSWKELADRAGSLSFIGTAVMDAAKLQSQMNDIRISSGLTVEQMGHMERALRDLSMPDETNQSVEDLGKAVQELIDGGLSSDQALVALRSVGRVATATGDDITDLAKTSAVLVDTLGIAPEGLSTALDQMATIAGAGSVTLKDMGQYLPMLGAEAKTMGLQGTEAMLSMGAALEVVKKDSLSSADAAKGMQSFMTQVNSSKVQEKFKKLGIDLPKVMAEAAAKGENPMEAVLAKIDGALGSDPGKRQAMLGDLFANKQAQDFTTAMLSRLPEYYQLKAEALASVGNVDADYAKRMEEANQQMKAVTQAADGLSSAVGGALLSAFTMVMKPIVPVLKLLSDFALSSPRTTAGIVGIVGALTLLPPILSIVLASWRIVGAAFKTNLLGLAITGLILGVSWVMENLDKAIALYDSVVDAVSGAFSFGSDEEDTQEEPKNSSRQAAKAQQDIQDRLAAEQAKAEAEQQVAMANAAIPEPVLSSIAKPPSPPMPPPMPMAGDAMETTAMPNGGAGLRAMAGNGVQAAQALAQAARIDVLVRFLNPPSGTTMQTSSSDNNIRVSAAVGYAMGD